MYNFMEFTQLKNELCCMILYMFSNASVMAQYKIILSLTQENRNKETRNSNYAFYLQILGRVFCHLL